MKRRWKRTLSLLLAIIMVFSLLPVTAWAVKQRSEDEWKESTYGQKLVEDGYTFAGSYILKGTDIIYARRYLYG